MLSATVMSLSGMPRHEGAVERPTHRGQLGTPGEGPYVKFTLREREGTIEECRFQTYSCPHARAFCELLCRLMAGRTLAFSNELTARDLVVLVREVPEGKRDLAQLALSAFQSMADRTPDEA
ncbi:MAG: iron-sulfur cluster assembly scaffold protein [Armatimonadetes bacterium]|nr:iron-sulfur cluster assembly scaffold protein [Armatimonadota bacterium]